MQSVFCTFEYKMKAGHFVRSFFVWVRGLFAAVDGSVVMPVKQCGRLRAKHRKQGLPVKQDGRVRFVVPKILGSTCTVFYIKNN